MFVSVPDEGMTVPCSDGRPGARSLATDGTRVTFVAEVPGLQFNNVLPRDEAARSHGHVPSGVSYGTAYRYRP